MEVLYTIGYEGRSLDEYVALLRTAGIGALVDVRDNPISRKPGFSRKGMSQRLVEHGVEYVSARFAGNPKSLRAAAKNNAEMLDSYREHIARNPSIVAEFDELVRGLHARGLNVCIGCFERDPDECHRGVIASSWARRGERQVRHLGTE